MHSVTTDRTGDWLVRVELVVPGELARILSGREREGLGTEALVEFEGVPAKRINEVVRAAQVRTGLRLAGDKMSQAAAELELAKDRAAAAKAQFADLVKEVGDLINSKGDA